MRVKALKEENSFEGLITLVKSRTLLRKYYCFFYILQLSTISVAGCGLGEISGQNYLIMPQWEISRMIKFSFVLYILWFCNQKFSWFLPFLRKFVLRKKRINLQFFFLFAKNEVTWNVHAKRVLKLINSSSFLRVFSRIFIFPKISVAKNLPSRNFPLKKFSRIGETNFAEFDFANWQILNFLYRI